MSQENVDLAHRSIDAVNRRDLDAFLALMHEDVESVSRIVAIEGGLHGHDGVRRWWENWFEAFPDYRFEVAATRDLGDLTLTSFRAVGRGGGSKLPLEDKAYLAIRWRDGAAVRWQVFNTEAEALEAVGPSE